MSFNALHHLPDFWKQVAIGRMASWLKPGAYLVLRDIIFSFDPASYREAIEHWINQLVARDFEAHVREEYSTYAWIIDGMITVPLALTGIVSRDLVRALEIDSGRLIDSRQARTSRASSNLSRK